MTELSIAKEFSATPSGRYRSHGPKTGEHFREDFLVPALQSGEHLTVIFDGMKLAPNSFLEEAFGGLIRDHNFQLHDLREQMDLVADDPVLKLFAERAWLHLERSHVQKNGE